LLIALLKWAEYRFLVTAHSVEIYGGLVAATFAVLGSWLGLKLTGRQERIVVKEVPLAVGKPFVADEKARGPGYYAARAGDPEIDSTGNQ